jgi:uncharacterized membrane protein YfhO
MPIESNERVQHDYDVTQYDANNIEIRVASAKRGEWLYYADCWHPFWTATVNGKETSVHKANLAYKAVELEDGANIVRFRFHSSRLTFLMSVVNWNALIWVILPFYFVWRASSSAEEVLVHPE